MPLPSDQEPRRQVVLLGASNIVRGLTRVADGARRAWGTPLDILIAAGHGRSYGLHSHVFWRRLPPINGCGLWPALQQRPAAPSAGLITDIGNDILYGADVPHITGWVRECLERLRERCDPLVITGPPLDSIRSLSKIRFSAARTLLFPASRLRFQEALDKCSALQESVSELAEEFGAELVSLKRDWYGVDPVHIQMAKSNEAWRELLAPWGSEPPRMRPTWRDWSLLRRARHEVRWILGVEQLHRQPCVELDDGSIVSMF